MRRWNRRCCSSSSQKRWYILRPSKVFDDVNGLQEQVTVIWSESTNEAWMGRLNTILCSSGIGLVLTWTLIQTHGVPTPNGAHNYSILSWAILVSNFDHSLWCWLFITQLAFKVSHLLYYVTVMCNYMQVLLINSKLLNFHFSFFELAFICKWWKWAVEIEGWRLKEWSFETCWNEILSFYFLFIHTCTFFYICFCKYCSQYPVLSVGFDASHLLNISWALIRLFNTLLILRLSIARIRVGHTCVQAWVHTCVQYWVWCRVWIRQYGKFAGLRLPVWSLLGPLDPDPGFWIELA